MKKNEADMGAELEGMRWKVIAFILAVIVCHIQ